MTAPSRADRAPATAVTAMAGSLVAAVTLGVGTAYGQHWLPDDLGSLANSAGTWCAAAFALALPAPRPRVAAAVATIALLGLLGGYVLGAATRGDPSSSSLVVFWGLAALVAGPLLGIAACAVARGTTYPAAAGIAVISGVLVGEGIYGLTLISDTTYPPYWWTQIAVGISTVAFVAIRRLRRAGPTAAAAAAAGAVAASFVSIYALNPIVLLS